MAIALDDLPSKVRALTDAFRPELERILGDRFAGLFLYGAAMFPPSVVTDYDYHVLLDGRPTDDQLSRLRALHERLARDVPLGDDMDGYYVTLDAARGTEPPRTELQPDVVDGAWALHRAHVHAGRYVHVCGLDPVTVLAPPAWPELDDALRWELAYVREHLDRPGHGAFCALNLCRILSSYENTDVVTSKYHAALWALGALETEHHAAIRASLEAYATGSHVGVVIEGSFVNEVTRRIGAARELSSLLR